MGRADSISTAYFSTKISSRISRRSSFVLTFGRKFYQYHATSEEFVQLYEPEVDALSEERRVIRLIEANSSEFSGWKGMSILFASPGLKGMANFDSITYVMPVWTLTELQKYNIIIGNKFELEKSALIERYDKFGGIPRFIFATNVDENEVKLNQAINSFNASRRLSKRTP